MSGSQPTLALSTIFPVNSATNPTTHSFLTHHDIFYSARKSPEGGCKCSCRPLDPVSGRSYKVTCSGCIVSLTTPTSSLFSASRSVSSVSLALNASSVFLESYFLR
jgi:hypothetical protein